MKLRFILVLSFFVSAQVFSQSPEENLSMEIAIKGFDQLLAGNLENAAILAREALEFNKENSWALHSLAASDPIDRNHRLALLQRAMSNPILPEELLQHLIPLLAATNYQLGDYDYYETLELRFPRLLLTPDHIWMGVQSRFLSGKDPGSLLSASMDLFPFSLDNALLALIFPTSREKALLRLGRVEDFDGLANPKTLELLTFHLDRLGQDSNITRILSSFNLSSPDLEVVLSGYENTLMTDKWYLGLRLLGLYGPETLGKQPWIVDMNKDLIPDGFVFEVSGRVIFSQDIDQSDHLFEIRDPLDETWDRVFVWEDSLLKEIRVSQYSPLSMGRNHTTLHYRDYPVAGQLIHWSDHSTQEYLFPPGELILPVQMEVPENWPEEFLPFLLLDRPLPMDLATFGNQQVLMRESLNNNIIREWIVYRGFPIEMREDHFGRGEFDTRITFDRGKPSEISMDIDGNGIMETRGFFNQGELNTLLVDTDGNMIYDYRIIRNNGVMDTWDLDQDGDFEMNMVWEAQNINVNQLRYPYDGQSIEEFAFWRSY